MHAQSVEAAPLTARVLRAAALAFLCSSLQYPVDAQEALGIAQLREDARLSQKISLRKSSSYVGDVLERLAHLSHVTLLSGDGDGAGDETVTVLLRDAPLADVMEGIRSLFSYRLAEWRWTRSGSPGAYSYRLVRPKAARELAARFRGLIQEEFEGDVELLIRAARAPADQRRELLAHYVEASGRQDSLMQLLLDSRSERKWEGLRLFASVLTPQQQRDVLRASGEWRIPIAQATGEVQTVIARLQAQPAPGHEAANLKPSAPNPQSLYIRTRSNANPPTPSLWIGLEPGPGFTLAGARSLYERVKARLKKMWVLTDETETWEGTGATIRQTQTQPPGSSKTEFGGSNVPGIERFNERLEQAATATGDSIIARVPTEIGYDPGPPFGKTVREFLDELDRRGNFAKRSGAITLITASDWYDPKVEEQKLPWAVARRFGIGNRDFVPKLADIADLANLPLCTAQIDRIVSEHPEFMVIKHWQGLFQTLGRDAVWLKAVTSPAGLEITQALRLQLFADGVAPRRVNPEEVTAVRINHWVEGDNQSARGYDVELRLKADGTWKPLMRAR